jgi:hypothetical protein
MLLASLADLIDGSLVLVSVMVYVMSYFSIKGNVVK